MAERDKVGRRRERGFIAISTTFALVATTAGFVLGDLGGNALLDLLPGTGWIAADDSVQRVDGAAGEIDGGIALTDEEGAPELFQEGDEIYFRTDDGTLVRVEESTLGRGGSVRIDDTTFPVEAGGVLWLVSTGGEAAPLDATTMVSLGEPVDLGGQVDPDGGAAVDDAGRLFAVLDGTGQVVATATDGPIDRFRLADDGDRIRLTRLDARIVAVDVDGRSVSEIDADGPGPAISLPRGGDLLTRPVLEGDELWLVDVELGLIRVDLERRRHDPPIELDPPGEGRVYGAPLVSSGFVYVPVLDPEASGDANDDTLLSIEIETGETRPIAIPSRADLSVRDGLVIVDGDGTNTTIFEGRDTSVPDLGEEELPRPFPPDFGETTDEEEPEGGDDEPGGGDETGGDDEPGGEAVGGGDDGSGGGDEPAPTRVEPVPPDAPATAEAFAGDETATVTWSPPLVDGGAAITSYEVSYDNGSGGTVEETFAADVRSTEIEGLVNGEPYTFEVRAENEAGVGEPATTSEITPTAEVPEAPASASAAPQGRQAINVTWEPPAAGTRTIEQYLVECTSGTAPSGSAQTDGDARAALVEGLVGGAAYVCGVRAVNTADVPSSPTLAPEAQAQDVPAAPSATASPTTGGVAVSWSAPPDNGRPVTGYSLILNGTRRDTVDLGMTVPLPRGGPYTCSVIAHNELGPSLEGPCGGDASSALNRAPDAVDDPAAAMGGFVWGPADGNTLKCFTTASPPYQAPNPITGSAGPDTDDDGDSLTLTILSTNIGSRQDGLADEERFGSGQSYVRISHTGEVRELCVHRNAAVNLASQGGNVRITYQVSDGYGGTDTADIRFYVFCRATAGGTAGPCT